MYEQIEARYSQDQQPNMRQLVAKALLYKGITLGQLGRDDAAIQVYEDIERRFGNDSKPGIREHVAKAQFNKAQRVASRKRKGPGSDPAP